MSRPIEEQELDQALSNTRLGKSPGPDGILPEILVHGGHRLRAFLLVLFNICWTTEIIPLDWIDAIIAILFKKGDRSQCGNYRGISLLSAVGKFFADVILQRVHLLADSIYPQSQSGYHHGRSTIDGIFTLRQLMEKTREQRRCLYIAFVDFVKAFDTVNRELLFIIIGKLGCPPKFITIIKKLYTDVHARLAVDGELTKSVDYNSGVKQGCKLAQNVLVSTQQSYSGSLLRKSSTPAVYRSDYVMMAIFLTYADLKQNPKSLQSLSEKPSMLMTLQFAVTRQRVFSRY